jgi:hypothetical protein
MHMCTNALILCLLGLRLSSTSKFIQGSSLLLCRLTKNWENFGLLSYYYDTKIIDNFISFSWGGFSVLKHHQLVLTQEAVQQRADCLGYANWACVTILSLACQYWLSIGLDRTYMKVDWLAIICPWLSMCSISMNTIDWLDIIGPM